MVQSTALSRGVRTRWWLLSPFLSPYTKWTDIWSYLAERAESAGEDAECKPELRKSEDRDLWPSSLSRAHRTTAPRMSQALESQCSCRTQILMGGQHFLCNGRLCSWTLRSASAEGDVENPLQMWLWIFRLLDKDASTRGDGKLDSKVALEASSRNRSPRCMLVPARADQMVEHVKRRLLSLSLSCGVTMSGLRDSSSSVFSMTDICLSRIVLTRVFGKICQCVRL